MYFTSWDANVFLCLLSVFPEDVVRRMIRLIKVTHEAYSLQEARDYWEYNSPRLVKQPSTDNPRCRFRFKVDDRDKIETIGNYLTFSMVKFHQEWRMRSIEDRQQKVIDWCNFGEDFEQRRHQDRLSTCLIRDGFGNTREKNPDLKKERINYTKNLWSTWEACASSYYFVGWDRRNYVSKWYEGIHPGRFFLFYKKNKLIEERYRGVPKGPCEDGYRYPQTPIFNLGPYEQLIEDLRCLDGPGIGEPTGSKVEHIDDMFS